MFKSVQGELAQFQYSSWAEHLFHMLPTEKEYCHLRAYCTLTEIYCQKSVLLAGRGIVEKQGIDISLDSIVFTCM